MATDENKKTGVDIEFMGELKGQFNKALSAIEGLSAETSKALINQVSNKVSDSRAIYKIFIEAREADENTVSAVEEVRG